jgi:hypothetical protein
MVTYQPVEVLSPRDLDGIADRWDECRGKQGRHERGRCEG